MRENYLHARGCENYLRARGRENYLRARGCENYLRARGRLGLFVDISDRPFKAIPLGYFQTCTQTRGIKNY